MDLLRSHNEVQFPLVKIRNMCGNTDNHLAKLFVRKIPSVNTRNSVIVCSCRISEVDIFIVAELHPLSRILKFGADLALSAMYAMDYFTNGN